MLRSSGRETPRYGGRGKLPGYLPGAGPVGTAFANSLASQRQGHSNLLAVLEPNLAVKPSTVLITKVTIKGAKQAVQMFGPAQYAVAKAVANDDAHAALLSFVEGNQFLLLQLRVASLLFKTNHDTVNSSINLFPSNSRLGGTSGSNGRSTAS